MNEKRIPRKDLNKKEKYISLTREETKMKTGRTGYEDIAQNKGRLWKKQDEDLQADWDS